MQASHDFAEIRKHGTDKSSVLAQHFIVSFKPGEITPERALQLGQEICEQFLKGEYQYFMTCHIDKNHTHLHCVFNNTNCIDGKTFETHENRRTTKQDRSFQKLMNITDEVCRQHHLSVIEHPEMGKGKNHWEWDMSRQGLSWKAKLKFTIDQVIKVSENFEDFLAKCKDFGGAVMLKNPELAMPRTRKVTTVCNGKREVWTDYEEAKAYFLEMMMTAEGEKRDRAECIYIQLTHGLDECTDEDE